MTAQTGPVADSDAKAMLLSLITRAMEAKLSLEEAVEAIPPELWRHPFYGEVAAGVTGGVEHVPGKFFSREVDFSKWHASEEYAILYMDSRLLRADAALDTVQHVRGAIMKDEPVTRAKVEARLRELES